MDLFSYKKLENSTSNREVGLDSSGLEINNFAPEIGYTHHFKVQPFLNSINFHLDASSLLENFYGPFRWAGYVASSGYGIWNGRLTTAWRENKYPKLKNIFKDQKNLLNFLEGIGFTALSSVYAVVDLRKEHRDLDLAVAAELGKNPHAINLLDLKHSKNPLVQTEMDRYTYQDSARVLSGLSFFQSLLTGIFANASVITLERTVFNRPTGLDLLRKAVNDVQFNEVNDTSSRRMLVNNLIKVMQASRFDHRVPQIPRDQINELRPALDKFAGDLLDKRFGLKGAIYIMGGGIFIPGNPEQSMANYEHVQKVGVEGVAIENFHKRGAQIRIPPPANINIETANDNRPSSKITEARLADRKKPGYVAESATREELIRQRQKVIAHPRGSNGEVDDTRSIAIG